jgi:hypothetical protein
MRPGALVAVCLAGLTASAAAQASRGPELVFTIAAGEALGGHLWTVDHQPVLSSSGVDTVGLGRRLLRPSLVAALGAQLYLSPHLGYTLEATFLGLATASQCTPPPAFSPDPQGLNERTCTALQDKHTYSNAVALQAGLTARTTTGRSVQAYGRAVGGVAVLRGSFVTSESAVYVSESGGTSVVNNRFLVEASPKVFTWVASIGGGLAMALGRSYNLRFEMREVFIRLPVPTGPGHPLAALAPVGWRTIQLPTLTA